MLHQSLVFKIKDDLRRHEGVRYDVYLDTEGLKTAGVGHLLDQDAWEVGDEVDEAQVEAWFEEDVQTAIRDAADLVTIKHPENVMRVMVNMAFNLGKPRLSNFKNMLKAVNAHDYNTAADEMIDSRWYGQVGRRSEELVEMMRG